jgi:hypothetical protein
MNMNDDAGKEKIAGEKVIPMDCAQFQEILHDLDRPGTQGSTVCENALAHAETCSDCAAMVTEVESLDFALRQMAEESSDMQASAKLETNLLREFRQAKSRTASRRVGWQLAALAMAAVVLLLALGLTLHRGVTAPKIGPNEAIHNGQAAGAADSTLRADDSAPTDATVDADTSDDEVSLADDSENASAYVPLPYADDPSGLEGGAVVRVVLPRAALVSYGLPADAIGVGDQVTADMVVSEDGTPQAIRLLSQEETSTDF